MTTQALLEYLANSGVVLTPDGTLLRYRAPKGILTPALRLEISRRKVQILAILQSTTALVNQWPSVNAPFLTNPNAISKRAEIVWPAECLECEQKIGQKHARLFPLLGRQVETPIGAGVLKQVFQSRAAILINDRLVFVKPEQVLPFDCDDFPMTTLDRSISVDAARQESTEESTKLGKARAKS